MKKKLCLVLPLAALLLWGCQKEEGPDYVGNGLQAIEQMEYQSAVESFDAAISAGIEEVAAYRGKGIAYMGLGEYEKAAEAFDSAYLLTDDKMPETKRDILYYKATALYRAENYDDTIAVCSSILENNPEGDAYYLRGACYMEKDEYDQAKLDFDCAVKYAPKDYDLYLNIYSCYLEKSRSADGYTYLNQALSIQDSSEEASYQKARIYFFLEDYEQAKTYLDGLVEKKNQEAMELMGKVYLELGDTTHARKCYQDLIDHFEETPEYDNGLVLCDMAEGNYAQALENILKGMALSQQEGKQELLYNWIVVLEYQGDFEGAKEKAREYVELYPSDEKGQREYTFLESR